MCYYFKMEKTPFYAPDQADGKLEDDLRPNASDDPGAGKTTMAGLLIKELIAPARGTTMFT